MNAFGQLLRFHRLRAQDPSGDGSLTQGRLGELLGEKLGIFGGYSGASVSLWELGKTRIAADDRRVLLALVQVLRETGGIKTLEEADALLHAGDYRALDASEVERIFPGADMDNLSVGGAGWKMLKTMFGELAWRPRNLWADVEDARAADQQPGPAHWTDAVVLVMQRLFAGWTGGRFLRALAWFILWLAAWVSAIPFFTWPFPDPAAAGQAALLFAGGVSLVPLGIGLLCNTRADVYWQAQKQAHPGLVRFYTHAGAALGYTCSLILVFLAALVVYYFSGRPLPAWLLGTLLVPVLVVGLTGARQAPINLWRAYRSLALRDGWFLAVFFGVGIFWAAYFYLFYPWLLNRILGALILLAAFATVGTIAVKQQRSDK